ncbi:uncharacterized protein LOC128660608 isoform X1 [Bombina bombina]|uniref:uncharacterized protein LOC128660608 isoform X1 n=1 Tax=Bombina bombina TaxID=8345 RepID=UPI00235A71D4|nr:uncharacterized protein LOC128660608 isoform X1 [Bombina bombina]
MNRRFSEKFPSAKSQKGSVYCSICDIVCSSQESLAMHIDGKKHKHFAAKVNNPSEYCSFSATVNNPLESTYCSVCDINLQNQNVLAKHLAGKKHKIQLGLEIYVKNKPGPASESLPSCKSDNTANKSDEERMQKKSSIKLEETRPPIKRDANLKGEDPKNENSPQFESIQELQEFLTNYKIENEEDAAFAYQTSRLLSNLVLSYTSRRKIKVGGKQAKIPKVEPVSTFDNENVLRSQEEEKQAETPKVEPVQKSYNENILLRSQEEEKQEETPNVEHVPTFDIGGFYGVLNNKSEEEIKSSIQELTEILKQQLPSM